MVSGSCYDTTGGKNTVGSVGWNTDPSPKKCWGFITTCPFDWEIRRFLPFIKLDSCHNTCNKGKTWIFRATNYKPQNYKICLGITTETLVALKLLQEKAVSSKAALTSPTWCEMKWQHFATKSQRWKSTGCVIALLRTDQFSGLGAIGVIGWSFGFLIQRQLHCKHLCPAGTSPAVPTSHPSHDTQQHLRELLRPLHTWNSLLPFPTCLVLPACSDRT